MLNVSLIQFPVIFHLGLLNLHAHFVFETLAYFIGFRVYLYTRSNNRLDRVRTLWVIIGAALGAAAGSKILYWLEDPILTLQNWMEPEYWMGGKTIVGGLLGGLIGVETTKRIVNVRHSTGDDFVFPIIVGMCIGRVGCFLSGLGDHTYGTPTSWLTGVDFGDGITRHPTQLYEIAFLLLLSLGLLVMKRTGDSGRLVLSQGALFQLFMTGYLLFRFGVDFIKPVPHVYGILNNVQIACVLGLLYYARLIAAKRSIRLPERGHSEHG